MVQIHLGYGDLKVFVWGDDQSFLQDYSAGLGVAIAHDVREARLLIMEEYGASSIDDVSGLEREPDVYPMGMQAHFTYGGS